MTDKTSTIPAEDTEVGSYFVANYPPFSVWRPEAVAADASPALHSAPVPGTPLGLYLHIPFCRKRCHFCYFRVYTDKNAQEVSELSRPAGPGVGALPRPAGISRPGARFRLLRRRHALVPLHQAAREPRVATAGGQALARRERGHLRVRAGHPDRSQAVGHSEHRRDAPQPGCRELRRSPARAERAGAPIDGDLRGRTSSRAISTFRRSTSISLPACSARPMRTGPTRSAAHWRSIRTA